MNFYDLYHPLSIKNFTIIDLFLSLGFTLLLFSKSIRKLSELLSTELIYLLFLSYKNLDISKILFELQFKADDKNNLIQVD